MISSLPLLLAVFNMTLLKFTLPHNGIPTIVWDMKVFGPVFSQTEALLAIPINKQLWTHIFYEIEQVK